VIVIFEEDGVTVTRGVIGAGGATVTEADPMLLLKVAELEESGA
jgi:hypothetical protein